MIVVALAGWLLLAEPAGLRPDLAASPTPAAPSATEEATEVAYQVGPGDVIEVDVFGNDDLSRTATVQTNGTITLPLLGDVTVAGLAPRAVADRLTELLGRDYLVNPQVEVRIKEYLSQFVSVVGEVQQPGRKAIKGRTRLIDALVDAGGFTTRASGEVIVTRINGEFPDGGHTLTVRLGGGLTTDTQHLVESPLRNGDIVTVVSRQFVTVDGEVQRPNRYPLDGELTVTGAISLAGGLTRFGSSDVKVRRVIPATGQTEIHKVDLKAVRKGKQPDLALKPNDVISVARRLF